MIKASVIIPTLNRDKNLKKTLESISQINTNQNDFEIIIVDNGSIDETEAISINFKNDNKIKNLHYYYDSTPGLLTGRHLGFFKSVGEIIVFIDDDIIVSSEWLNSILYTCEKYSNYELFTGPVFPLFDVYPPDWLKYFWNKTTNGDELCGWLSLMNLGTKIKEIDPIMVWGLNFIIRRNTFISLEGFNPDIMSFEFHKFQGDGETGLCYKAKHNNIKALYNPNILIYHQISSSRLSIEYFEKRAYFQGICDSYSKIRNNYYFKRSISKSKKNSNLYYLRKYILKIFALIFNKKINRQKKNINNSEEFLLKERFEKKRMEGFIFHNNMYNTDLSVNQWVLKRNYLNYKIENNDRIYKK